MNVKQLDLSGNKIIHHLEQVIKWRNGDYFPPPYVEINPTDNCNQRCFYCFCDYLGHKKIEIAPKKLIETIADFQKAGVKAIYIQGAGEPLLNVGVPDGIVAGKEAGLGVSLSTNGVLLNRAILNKILPCLSWLLIGQVELNPQLYAKSHGCNENQWQEVIDNIKIAVEIRDKLNLSETLISTHLMPFPHNYAHVFETAKMVKDIGADYINFKPANQREENKNIGNWPRDVYKICNEQLQRAKIELEDDSFFVNVKLHEFEHVEKAGPILSGYDKCFGVEFETLLDADGGIYPCCELWRREEYCYGNIYENSFEEIWRSERKKKVLEKFYREYNVYKCSTHGACKQGKINQILWDIKNPPVHKEFI